MRLFLVYICMKLILWIEVCFKQFCWVCEISHSFIEQDKVKMNKMEMEFNINYIICTCPLVTVTWGCWSARRKPGEDNILFIILYFITFILCRMTGLQAARGINSIKISPDAESTRYRVEEMDPQYRLWGRRKVHRLIQAMADTQAGGFL